MRPMWFPVMPDPVDGYVLVTCVASTRTLYVLVEGPVPESWDEPHAPMMRVHDQSGTALTFLALSSSGAKRRGRVYVGEFAVPTDATMLHVTLSVNDADVFVASASRA